MTSQELLLCLFCVGAPTLVIGFAILGSRLQPQVKRRVETYFLMPLAVVIAASVAVIAAIEHWWVQLAAYVLFFAFAVERLVRRLREPRPGPQAH